MEQTQPRRTRHTGWVRKKKCKETQVRLLEGAKQAARDLRQQRPPLHKPRHQVCQRGALRQAGRAGTKQGLRFPA